VILAREESTFRPLLDANKFPKKICGDRKELIDMEDAT
jgi:hypothetical protein